MQEIQYLGRQPRGVRLEEVEAAAHHEVLEGRDPSGIAFGAEGQLYHVFSNGEIGVKESPDQ